MAEVRDAVRLVYRHHIETQGRLAEAAGRGKDPRRAHDPTPLVGVQGSPTIKIGAGNGIRTRDFDLGKVALYH